METDDVQEVVQEPEDGRSQSEEEKAGSRMGRAFLTCVDEATFASDGFTGLRRFRRDGCHDSRHGLAEEIRVAFGPTCCYFHGWLKMVMRRE
jgi:hypothetical protein